MARVSKAHPHLSEQEIWDRIKGARDYNRVRKWLVIFNATVDPRPAREIALHVGLATGTVHNLISNYNRYDPDALDGIGRGGRRRAHLTRDEEAEFLKPFFEAATEGQIVIGAQIGRALEEHLGQTLHHSVVYRFLHRNGWRQVVPRPFHVQAKHEVQQEFKKNSLKR